MKRKFALIFLVLFSLGFSASAQDSGSNSNEETYQPNLRGSLLFAVGLNFLNNEPRDFNISPWNSKSVNIYYLYEVPLGNSNFSFNPGIGLGLEKYEFENYTTLTYLEPDDVPGFDSDMPILVMDSVRNVLDVSGTLLTKKNRLAANYIDIPLEFSYASNETNPKAGLLVALGGKVGVLYSAHTKIKFEENGETQKVKHHRQWELNRFRYSAHTRIGYGGFNLYFELQFSDLFDSEFGGPLHRTLTDDTSENFTAPYRRFPDITNYRIGLAIDLF